MLDSTLLAVDVFNGSDTYVAASRIVPNGVFAIEAKVVDPDGVLRESFG